jgi:hypothetical protein
MFAKFLERQAGGVLALAAVGAVEVGIVDVGEGSGLELGIVHAPKVTREGCGLLVYKSYSERAARTLYGESDLFCKRGGTRSSWAGRRESIPGGCGENIPVFHAPSKDYVSRPTRNLSGVHYRSPCSCASGARFDSSSPGEFGDGGCHSVSTA